MARSNLQIKIGTYTGDGTDNRNLTGFGFRPAFFFTKGGSTNPPFTLSTLRRESSGFITSTNSNLSNYIQERLNDGVQLGSTTNVNGNGTIYYYLAIGASSSQKYFHIGRYYGDGTDNRDLITQGVSFTPDLVIIQQVGGATKAVFRTSAHSGDLTSTFDNVAAAADKIQTLESNGFQLGTSGDVNVANGEYVFMAMKNIPGAFKVGTFSGTGAQQSITGLGFSPSMVLVKVNNTNVVRFLSTDMVTSGAGCQTINSTGDANGILSLDSDGFTVGTSAGVNQSGVNVIWMAFKSGNFSVPISRNSV